MSKCTCAFPCGGTECGPYAVGNVIKELSEELYNTRHELALLMNKHYRKPWCCKFASSTNGWNHDPDCKNFVVCF